MKFSSTLFVAALSTFSIVAAFSVVTVNTAPITSSCSASSRVVATTMKMTTNSHDPAGSGAFVAPLSSRRQALIGASATTLASLALAIGLPPAALADNDDGVGTCPKGSQNCIRTTWTPPAGTSPSQATKTLKDVLEAYPQEGYDGVDLGGWKIVEDNFGSPGGVSRVEFTSGIGNFAKFLNGGKPFVDDLRLQVDPPSGAVQVKSNSRVGDSDLGVNQKRLAYFVKALQEKGWDAPEPKY